MASGIEKTAPRRIPTLIIERRPVPTDKPDLFRPEVLTDRQAQWLGTVLLEPKIGAWVAAAFALASATAVLLLLLLGTYTSKAAIEGWLVPRAGLVRVFAPQAGVVKSVDVQEGAQVAKGAPLVAISTEVQSQSVGATREEMVRQLRDRRDSTAAGEPVQERLFDEQASDLKRRLTALTNESEHLAQEMELQRSREQVSQVALERTRKLRGRGLVTQPQAERAEQDRLEQAARTHELQRLRDALQRDQSQLQGDLQQLPMRRETQIAEIKRSVSSLDQELADMESRREIVLVAPQDGTVAALQAAPGGAANPSHPLLSIIPTGSDLQAELFGRSQAVGFVHEGQVVMLRYAAFPYQKFGSYEGVVSSVSRSAISPSELPQELAGFSGISDATEPLYRIVVDLRRQTAAAYGAAVPLQPGMQLQADILIEKRRLFEWVLDPLFTLTGTWH